MNILVSGASSGLGRYLREKFQADAFDRQAYAAPKTEYDLIIHCAFNAAGNLPASHITDYVNDNITLTEWLLAIPHRQFIFLSSAAVYPVNTESYSEELEFDVGTINNLYGTMKLLCEGLVQSRAVQPLILRAAPMLGPYIRRNAVMRMLLDENPKLALSAESDFNYILHDQVEDFIRAAQRNALCGIYNLAACANIRLGEIARHFERKVAFGDQVIRIPLLDNRKAAQHVGTFGCSSLQNIESFIKEFTRTAHRPS